MSGRASIKGKLKLSFTSTSAKKIVAVKLFQLTQKAKGKREYKQLDSVLKTTGSDGKEITLSHKCSDMEKLVPNLLGVSKSILDLVIFCHQEESLCVIRMCLESMGGRLFSLEFLLLLSLSVSVCLFSSSDGP